MRKGLYPKLAISNMRKNSKTYAPYILTCICTIAMFYIIGDISRNTGLDHMSGGDALKQILTLGTYVIGVFAVIFLFYTNSFLIKRRKKEIGIYSILGMEKKHIARMLLWETLYTALISMLLGIVGGVLLSKLLFLILLKILHFSVPFVFAVSIPSMVTSVCLFVIIFAATLLYNLLEIHLANPIELLQGQSQGEKEPKTKWIMTIIGVLCLGAGYYISLTTKSPLDALAWFFAAVILVIIGTHALFAAGSITVLKLLRRNKDFYYKSRNFTSVSGMIYRMKQNAAGLANICILSTCVLVVISTTISLYVGMDDILRTRFPNDVAVEATNIPQGDQAKLQQIVKNELENFDVEIHDTMSYQYITWYATQKDDAFIEQKVTDFTTQNLCSIEAISVNEYNRMQKQSVALEPNSILIYTDNGTLEGNSLVLDGEEYHIKKRLDKLPVPQTRESGVMDVYYIVVDENTANAFGSSKNIEYRLSFNVDGKDQEILRFVDALVLKMQNTENTNVQSLHQNKEDFYAMYGGLFFLGIFLGVLFLMATVLIIYYKQISEGYDDRQRFEIMQKVGMSKSEVRSSIRRQIIMVFFLPLIVAAIHIAFAFPVITKLLAVMNLTNVKLFFIFTVVSVLVFAVIYTIVYTLTARAYYHIISE